MKYTLYVDGEPITNIEIKPCTLEIPYRPMTDKDIYLQTLSNRIDAINESLSRKNAEYASDNSPYHNFDNAGDMDGITPEEALWGMVLKQLVSVRDMVKGGKVTPYLVNEKIGDVVNYMILLEGLLIRKLRDGRLDE